MLAINRCFVDAVLDGRTVEMIDITPVTLELVVLRFDGQGFVERYMEEDDGPGRGWYRREASLILGTIVFWSLDGPFDRTKIE